MADGVKRKRGRPPLPPDQKKPKNPGINSTKGGGYATQKKYAATHKGEIYEPKIRIKIKYKSALTQLMAETGMSLTELCLTALEEKYNITLHEKIDKR